MMDAIFCDLVPFGSDWDVSGSKPERKLLPLTGDAV